MSKQDHNISQSNVIQKSTTSFDHKGQAHIGHFQHAPQYMQDNFHITHGYRINFDTPKKIIRSLFMVHNQSVNIWTHLIAAILLIAVIIYLSVTIFTYHHSGNDELLLYKDNIGHSLNEYMGVLENKTLIDWLNIQNNTFVDKYKQLIYQIKQITVKIQNTLSEKYVDIKDEMSKKLNQNLIQFQKNKREFEKVILPQLYSEMAQKFNTSYLNAIKLKINQIKDQIDSQKFINFGNNLIPNVSKISKWPIVVFLISAFICLMCSSLFHLFYPMSKRTYVVFSRFDYAGINFLISGSGFPIFYYTMYCNFQVAIMYLTISMIGGFTLFLFSLAQWFHRPKYVKFRGWLYALYGLHYIFPVSHLLFDTILFDNYGDPFNFLTSFPYLLLVGASYLIGVSIYVKRCPQRNYPGNFNVCGHSHQIWHCFVLLGILFTYFAVINCFEMRKISVCPASTF